LNVNNIKLISNNPAKRIGLQGYGLNISEHIPLEIEPNEFNQKYLKTKKDKMGHDLHAQDLK
jgi:3,4-dihydroxy 2-butanone 4-phosphate synthase/GTP cyclohydrolase II